MNNQGPSNQANKYGTSRSTQSSANGQGHRPKLFDDETYDTSSKSIFTAAKSSHDNKQDDNTAHRTILETYSSELDRIYEDLKKRKYQN